MGTASKIPEFPARSTIEGIAAVARSLIADARREAMRMTGGTGDEDAIAAEAAAILRERRQEMRAAERGPDIEDHPRRRRGDHPARAARGPTEAAPTSARRLELDRASTMNDPHPPHNRNDTQGGPAYTSDLVFRGTRQKGEDETRRYAERLARARARRAACRSAGPSPAES